MAMVKGPNVERMRPEMRTATRFKLNPHWSFRGDNTKYKEKK